MVGVDETGCPVNGKTLWAWVFQNSELTYIRAGLSGKIKEFEEIMPSGMPHSVLVTDCFPGYFGQNVATHQICTAHILRELTFLSEVHETHTWPKRMKALIRDALQLRKAGFQQIEADAVFHRFQVLLNQVKYKSQINLYFRCC